MDTHSKLAEQEIAARIARERAQRVAALWASPVLTAAEAAEAVGMKLATWNLFQVRKLTPPMFKIGRARHIRTTDLRAWIDAQATPARPAPRKK